ncbi:MAG TPA: GNAT family N-acetyltransferase [Selenomonadales bacterium]|nr:GNAT family N-acetyltransferase [Selenomonadales bacterium]
MDYQYIKGYQANGSLLKSYFDFTRSVFRFDLSAWKNAGHWTDQYIPHSLAERGRIIANASASLMQLQIMGRAVPAVQLGSVGVLPEYRGKGLSRIILAKVLEEYRHLPLMFLFANPSVLDFYPKFGFRRAKESAFRIDASGCCAPRRKAARINAGSEELRRLLRAKLQHSSIIDARGNLPIYWYHLMYNYSENLYYIEEKDVVFIAEYQGDRAVIADVLAACPVNLAEIIGYLADQDTRTIDFKFTPDWLGEKYEALPHEGESLFVRGEFLPEDGPDFQFPVTAHT